MDFLDIFGALGYGVTAILYSFLAFLLLTSWRGHMVGGVLVAAMFASAVWAAGLAIQAAWLIVPVAWIWVLESLRDFAWVMFLLQLLQLQLSERSGLVGLFRVLRLSALVLGALLAFPVAELAAELGFFEDLNPDTSRLAVKVLFSLVGLVLVEQVYRNTPREHRWGVKFLCLGVAALFAYDFLFFADALPSMRMDSDAWLARGAANALIVPLIAVSTARNPQWSIHLFVSRKIIFHTTTLVSAGVYLLVASLAGHYISLYGGQWSAIFQTLFLFSAGLVLIILLLSGHLRSWLKVFVNKHFFNYKYDYREEWLHLISVLSGREMQATLPERIIFALGELVESPGGAIWLCTGRWACEYERSWNLSEAILDERETFGTLRNFLSRRRWIVNLDEYESDPDLYHGLKVPDWMSERGGLWLVVPLFHEDSLLGFVLLARPRTPQQLNWETLDLLKMAARQAASYLALEQAARALADARQFEGFNRLSAFVVHDLKNLTAQLSLVVKNAERYKNNPAFMEDALITVRNSVLKMNRLLTQLRGAVPGGQADRVELSEVLREAAREHSSAEPRPRLEVPDHGETIVYADKDRLIAVIGHIIHNAQDATRKDGALCVRLRLEGRQAWIEVEDDGIGMDAEFIRERLFKPFDSTKGLAGMGIGAYESREFIRSMGGQVKVFSTPGQGTRFSMIIPLAEGGELQGTMAASGGIGP